MSTGTTKNITRTILSSILHSYFLLNKPYKVYHNTTLNERFGIYPLDGLIDDPDDVAGQIGGFVPNIPGTTNPPVPRQCTIQAIVAGYGGHKLVMGPDGVTPMTQTVQHRSTDFALFKHMPFALKDIAAGEDTEFHQSGDSSKYLLRTIITKDSKQYAAYYALKLDTGAIAPYIQRIHIENNQVTDTELFTFDAGNLSPIAPELPADDLMITEAEYVTVTSLMEVIFNDKVAEEYRNAAEILFGTAEMAICSELGIVTGYLETKAMIGGGNKEELMQAQIITHMCSYQSLANSNAGFKTTLKLGATEPILSTTTV